MDVINLRNRRAVNRWDRVSVGDLFERVVWSFPDQEAIVAWDGAYADPGLRRVTYSQADRIANQVANALLGRGVSPGERVVMFCENSTEAYLTKIGIAKAGMTCVPLNPLIASDVIAYLIGRSEPTFTFVDAALWPAAQAAFAQHGLTPDVTIEIGGSSGPGSTSFADFIRDAPASEPAVEIHGDDIWEIIFTSGTTAMPKGAMVSHTYSYLAGYAFALTHSRGARLECDLKLLSFLPLIFHIADQIMSFPAFLCGGTLVIGRAFNAREVAAAIDRERPTSLWGGSPAMVGEVVSALQEGGHDATSLKLVIYGWTAARPPADRHAQARMRRGHRPGRDPRTNRSDRLPPILARQVARGVPGHGPGDELRRRSLPDRRR